MDTNILLLGVGLIIILSFIFNILAQKSNIPSVLMLMVLGYIVGHYLPLPESYEALQTTALSFLGTVGVILIVLEAALDLHLEKKKTGMIIKSLVLAAVLLVSTSGLIAVGLKVILEMSWLQAWLYAVPLSVMSSAIIIPSIGSLSAESKEFLTFEASFSDILGIILFYALAGAAGAAEEDSFVVLGSVGDVGITIVLSFILTYVLIIAFQSVKGHVKLFFLIAILLALYGGMKYLHYSPLLLILIFGLGLNNKELFFQGRLAYLIHDETFDEIVKEFRFITLESAFVVRTFFFVVFGMSIELAPLTDIWVWIITGIAVVAVYGTRFIGLKAAGRKINPEIFIAPRGLITVLLFYGMPANMVSEEFNTGILVLTILATSFVMSYGLIMNGRKGSSDPEETVPPSGTLEAAPVDNTPSSTTDSHA